MIIKDFLKYTVMLAKPGPSLYTLCDTYAPPLFPPPREIKVSKGYIDLARNEGCSILCGDGVDELSLPEQIKNVRIFTYHMCVNISVH